MTPTQPPPISSELQDEIEGGAVSAAEGAGYFPSSHM